MSLSLNSYFLLITILIGPILTTSKTQHPLPKLGHNSQCIKSVLDQFVHKQSCHHLKQIDKNTLAIKMVNCLNAQMGKVLIPECHDMKKCKIKGDDWNTFTSFLTHIDNLCHFYWDLLHHERTQTLIDGLSKSAFLAEDILKKNYQETKEILSAQTSIQASMAKSLASNQRLSKSLSESESKLQNMTSGIQSFLTKMNDNIFSQYSYLMKAVETINQGMEGINAFNSFMVSEINSMSGILYFLVVALTLGVLTSFRVLKNCRVQNFVILLVNILIQLCCPSCVLLAFGTKNIRVIFVFGHLVNFSRGLVYRKNELQMMKMEIDGRLSTRRIKRIFKELLEEAKFSHRENSE